MDDKPSRHWFRFSLRTFFVLFTVCALWLGWNVYQVRQRERVADYLMSLTNDGALIYGAPRKPWKSLPITWRLLGVKPVQTVKLEGWGIQAEDRGHIRAAFPEAEIIF